MAPKRKPAAQAAPIAPQNFSIAKKYTGAAAFRDVNEENIAKTAEYRTRCKLAKQKINELKQAIQSEVGAEQFEAAKRVLNSANEVAGQIQDLQAELAGMREIARSLEDVVRHLDDHEFATEDAIDLSADLTNNFADLRLAYSDLMGDEGPVTTSESQQMRDENARLQNENQMLVSQQTALRSLVVETCEAQIPAAQSVAVNLPAWLAPEADDPFEIIQLAISKLEDANEALRERCSQAEGVSEKKGAVVEELKAKIASLESEVEARDSIREVLERNTDQDKAAAVLQVRVDLLSSQINDANRKTEEARKQRTEWAQKCVNLHKDFASLVGLNRQLKYENVKLKIRIAAETLSEARIDQIRDQANERIKEAREGEQRLRREAQTTSDERILRAQDESKMLRDQLEQLIKSSNLEQTLRDQMEALQQSAAEQVNKANARAQQAEDDRATAIEGQKALLDTSKQYKSDIEGQQEKIERLEKELRVTNETLCKTEEQRNEAQQTIADFQEKEKNWRTKELTYQAMNEEFKECADDLKFALERIDEFKVEEEARQAEADAVLEQRLQDAMEM